MPSTVLSSNALITLDQAKRYLGFGVEDNLSQAEQSTIEELINASTEILEDWLGRKIKTQTVTDEVHTLSMELKINTLGQAYYTYPYYLQLKNFPMITVTAVKYDDVSQTITEGATSGYYYAAQDLKDTGRVYNANSWPCSPRTIKISYTAGWATVPYRIQQIAKEIMLFNYNKSLFGTSRNLLVNSSSDGTKSTSGTPAYRSLDEIHEYFLKEAGDLMAISV